MDLYKSDGNFGSLYFDVISVGVCKYSITLARVKKYYVYTHYRI
jgi:hypothetical protein